MCVIEEPDVGDCRDRTMFCPYGVKDCPTGILRFSKDFVANNRLLAMTHIFLSKNVYCFCCKNLYDKFK